MFMETFAVAAWGIWKERNDKLFRGIAPSTQSWLARFGLLVHRSKQNLEPFIVSFVNSL